MATTKKRINVTLSENLEEAIEALSERDNVPEATKARQLMEAAVEIEEDAILLEMAEAREAEGGPYVPHSEVLKKVMGDDK